MSYPELASKEPGTSSAEVRERVVKARAVQAERFKGRGGIFANAMIGPRGIRSWCAPDAEGAMLIKMAISQLGLSARAYDRILKVARTIADLEGADSVRSQHVAEAIQYRSLDRRLWM